jgi:hypothetical protein
MNSKSNQIVPRLFSLVVCFAFLLAGGMVRTAFAATLSKEFKAQIIQYKDSRAILLGELKGSIKQSPNATRQQKNIIVQQWRNENKDRLRAIKRQGESIHNQLKSILKQKQVEIKGLPPEERKNKMKIWRQENDAFFSILPPKPPPIESAKNKFRKVSESMRENQAQMEGQPPPPKKPPGPDRPKRPSGPDQHKRPPDQDRPKAPPPRMALEPPDSRENL